MLHSIDIQQCAGCNAACHFQPVSGERADRCGTEQAEPVSRHQCLPRDQGQENHVSSLFTTRASEATIERLDLKFADNARTDNNDDDAFGRERRRGARATAGNTRSLTRHHRTVLFHRIITKDLPRCCIERRLEWPTFFPTLIKLLLAYGQCMPQGMVSHRERVCFKGRGAQGTATIPPPSPPKTSLAFALSRFLPFSPNVGLVDIQVMSQDTILSTGGLGALPSPLFIHQAYIILYHVI